MAKQNSQNELSKKHIAHSERVRRQQRWVIIGISVFAALVVLVLGFGVIDQNYLQGERAAARIGNEKVTVSEFRNQTQLSRLANVQQFNYSQQIMEAALQLNDFESYLQAMYDLQRIQSQMFDANEFALNYLNAMIDDVLIRKEAGNFVPAIVVSENEVDESLQRLFNYFPNGTPTSEPTATLWVTPTFSRTQIAILGPTKTAFPTATLDPTLTSSTTPTQAPTSEQPPTATPAVTLGPLGTPTAYTQEGYQVNFQKYLEILAPYGVEEPDLREYWRTQLLRQKVFDALTKDIPTVVDQVWARHILVASEEEATQVISRLSSGEDFATLAEEVSIDPGTKSIGGDLGWFPTGIMVTEFEDAAFSMRIGETSQAVKSAMGYHIIQVLGREERPLSSRYLSIAKQKIYTDWITKLRSGTTITIDDLWKDYVPTEPIVEMPAQ
jgi:parvulin-like peptidyl-prolyl isomerase